MKFNYRIAYAVAALLGIQSAAIFAADSDSTGASGTLDEVVVTARKRSENLQDVPLSIDVFTSKDLQNLSITQFEDYAVRAPSVSFISTGPNTQAFFIRGVSDGSALGNNSTTGFFVDDLSMSRFGRIPDLHLYDVDRIEVLNGPQGTLFGASSMAGAIRVITKKADPNGFAAGVDLDGGKISGGRYNDSYQGFVNIPLVDGVSALRLAAYEVHQGGFINNLLGTRVWPNGTTSTNAQWAGDDFNTQSIMGARASYVQILPADWKLELTGAYQSQNFNGAWDQDPSHFGALNVQRFGPQYGEAYVRTLDLNIKGDVGIGDLVFASGYFSDPSKSTVEYSNYVQYSNFTGFPIAAFTCKSDPTYGNTPYTGCSVPTMWTESWGKLSRFSNEVRLESKAGGRAHWVTGAYLETTRSSGGEFWRYPGINFNGAAAQTELNYYGNVAKPLPEEWYMDASRTDYRQLSTFGDLTFDLTDRWSVEGGIEHFHSEFSTTQYEAVYFWNALNPSYVPGSSTKTNFKANVNYKADSNVLLYATFAQGFRDGAVNTGCNPVKVPAYAKPDTLNNFEIGWKSKTSDGRLLWNGAVYYMPWKNYETLIFDLETCPVTFSANIGDARIYGAESNVEYQPIDGLHLGVAANYNDPHILSNQYNNPAVVINPGQRLPFVTYFNYSADARYEIPVAADRRAYAQFDMAHKGDMWSTLNANNRVLQPAYEIYNLRFGLTPDDGRWNSELYISNLSDTHAVIYVNQYLYDKRSTTNQPRVVGLRFSYRVGKPK